MALLAMTACQKTEAPDSASGEVAVTVATSLPAQMMETRAAGDGTTVNRCIMGIYLDNKLYKRVDPVAIDNDLKATFSVRLVAGKTYDLVFWADKSGNDSDINTDLHYNTADLTNVTIADADPYTGNDDSRDAFFGNARIVADKSQNVEVELQRPFGQLNVKTLDMQAVADAAPALIPAKVKIAFKQVPAGINLLTGELTGEVKENITYAEAVAPVNNVNNAGELTFDYILAPKAEGEQRLVDFTMSFLNDSGAEVASPYEFSSIPVQRNYRTMVSGNLLTKQADITVEVKPGFDADINHTITEIKTTKDLNLFLGNGGNARLETDVTWSSMPMVMPFKDVNIDLNGHTLTFYNANGGTSGLKIYKNTTIRNGKIVAKMDSEVDAPLVCGSGYELTLDGVEMESEASCVGTVAEASNATIIVRNSTLKCNVYAVSTIAETPVGTNVTIDIEGSTLESSTPILVNVPCDLTIKDCTINGDTQGMILRGGTATIKNTTISLSTDDYASEEEAKQYANHFNTINWGSGNVVNISALTVGNKGGSSYQYPTILNLENTTLQCVGKYASVFPAMYVWANQSENMGVTITYDDQCTFTGDVIYGSDNIVVNGQSVEP